MARKKIALIGYGEVGRILGEDLRARGESVVAFDLKLSDARGHALREHARERASQSMVTNLGVAVVGAALGVGSAGTDLIGTVAKVSFELPNSREHETEADRIGVELAARGGYDPRAAISLWQKMAKVSNGAPPQWLSTHPSNETRQQDLQQYAARVMPLYEQATQRARPVK